MPVEYFHCTRFNFPQISVVSLTDREPLVPDGTGLEAGGRSTTPVLSAPDAARSSELSVHRDY